VYAEIAQPPLRRDSQSLLLGRITVRSRILDTAMVVMEGDRSRAGPFERLGVLNGSITSGSHILYQQR